MITESVDCGVRILNLLQYLCCGGEDNYCSVSNSESVYIVQIVQLLKGKNERLGVAVVVQLFRVVFYFHPSGAC